MTKKLTHETSYDAPLAAVAAMLADPAFRDEVATAQSATRTTVDIDGSGAGMSVLVDQVQPADGLPGFAKKFVGDEINIVQREEWTALDSADLHVTIPGKPGEMTGSVTLAEVGRVDDVHRRRRDQGEHPAGRREDRGPDRRPAAQGVGRRGEGRQRLLVALSLGLRLAGPDGDGARSPAPSTTNGPIANAIGQRLLDRVQRTQVERDHQPRNG